MFVILLAIADVVIGWEREFYEFNEGAMQAHVCATVLSGSLAVTLPALGIDTRDITASQSGSNVQQDYIPTPTPNEFIFSSMNMGRVCTNIAIVSDRLLEQTVEDFFADLAFPAGSEPDRVTVSPATTRVDIIDDDSKDCIEDIFNINCHNVAMQLQLVYSAFTALWCCFQASPLGS